MSEELLLTFWLAEKHRLDLRLSFISPTAPVHGGIFLLQ